MTDPIEERRVGGYTVRIDRSLCVGFGDCVETAPAAFDLDAQNVAMFKDPGAVAPQCLLAACAACPVDAISVLDTAGRPLDRQE